MKKEIDFAKNVIIIDVAYLNEMAYNLKKVMSIRLDRDLQDIDLPAWLSYLALDAGLREGDNEIQVLLVHNETPKLTCAHPDNLNSLQGMACRTPLGEFTFNCISTERLTTIEALFLDLTMLALDDARVERLMLVPYQAYYAGKLEDALQKFAEEKGKEACQKVMYFSMERLSKEFPCRWDYISYSLARVFGIRSDEM